MKRMIKETVLCILALVTASSCVKEKLETTYKKQETQIDSYLSRNNTARRDSTIINEDGTTRDTTWTDTLKIVYNGGVARLVKTKGHGPELSSHGAVSFYYAGYTFSGSINKAGLFVTNHQQTAESNGLNLTDPDYSLYEINMSETELIKGLHFGMIGVKAGEECEILFNGKDAFGNSTFGMIPANSALAFQIWVVSVSND